LHLARGSRQGQVQAGHRDGPGPGSPAGIASKPFGAVSGASPILAARAEPPAQIARRGPGVLADPRRARCAPRQSQSGAGRHQNTRD
jgi:hypothetical protein